MSERDDAVDDLGPRGVLAALAWAGRSAASRVLADFDGDTGHDQGWVGYSYHKLLKDRLDRVFSCGRYSVPTETDAHVGFDVLASGLSQSELDAMPAVDPGVVVRDDINGSPGWRCGEWRWLITSFPPGEANSISWSDRSPTKRRVALQPPPDQLVLNLTDVAPVLVDPVALTVEPTTTLVLGHSLSTSTGGVEILFGRARDNSEGGDAWHWKVNLDDEGPGGGRGGIGTPIEPSPSTPSSVPDAPVLLRSEKDREEPRTGSGR